MDSASPLDLAMLIELTILSHGGLGVADDTTDWVYTLAYDFLGKRGLVSRAIRLTQMIYAWPLAITTERPRVGSKLTCPVDSLFKSKPELYGLGSTCKDRAVRWPR